MTIKRTSWLLLKTHIDYKYRLFTSPLKFSLFFGFFLWYLWTWFLRKVYITVFLGRLPKIIPKRQQRGFSLEKVTKRLLWSLMVCSPLSSSNGWEAADHWMIPARDWAASWHPHGNPLGLRTLELLVRLIRALALHRISILQILASGTICLWNQDNPVRAQRSIVPPPGGAARTCLFVPRAERVQAGNRQQGNYERVGNLIQESLEEWVWAGLSRVAE